MIQINNLTAKYKHQIVLNNVTLSFDEGERVALIGVNGSGKTTLLKCISGLNKNYVGNIYYSDKTIGFLFDEIKINNYLTVKDFFKIYDIVPNTTTEKFICFDEFKNKKFNQLSLGYKKRAAFLSIINKDILLLDEPFNGLDFKSTDIIIDYITNELKNKTILISTHQISHLENLCTHIIFIHKGKVSQKFTMDEMLQKYSNIKIAADEIYAKLG
ncbi:MAG: ATP-binding cassette domain-containing protein [Bacteroidia bacterium]